MSALFTALLNAQNANIVVLAEIQPACQLGPWTKVGGLTITYSCPFSQYVQTAVVAGGLYRRLDQVRQNATHLVAQTSSANVDAHAGSYFFDSVNSILYVSMTDSSNPETQAFVGAWFTILVASGSASFADQPLYQPLLTSTLPTLDQEKPDLLFGATISDTGSIALLNTDGLWDALAKLWIWRNKLVTFKLGGVISDTQPPTPLAYSDYATIGAMLINTAVPDDELFTLQLETIGSVLNRSIPPKNVTDAIGGFTDPTLNLQSVALPWIIGTARDCKLTYSSTVGAEDVYTTVDIGFTSIANATAYAVNKTTGAKTTLAITTDYVLGAGSLTIQNNATYPHGTYEIWIDCNSSGFASTFGACVTAILEALGVPSSMIDATAFAALDAVSPTLGVFLTTPTLATDVIRAFEQSLNAQVYLRVDGVWTCRLFDPSTPAAYSLVDADFVTWTEAQAVKETLAATLSVVSVQYDTRNASGAYFSASASDASVQYGEETSDTTSVPTYLRNQGDAQALAGHDQFLKGAAPTQITAQMRGLQLMQASVGDMVAITRKRGPIARTGTLDGQIFEIIKLTKALAGPDGAPTVTVVLEDLGGQTDRIARCTDGTVVDWSSAVATDRAIWGWCSDSNGYIDATDIETKNLKVCI